MALDSPRVDSATASRVRTRNSRRECPGGLSTSQLMPGFTCIGTSKATERHDDRVTGALTGQAAWIDGDLTWATIFSVKHARFMCAMSLLSYFAIFIHDLVPTTKNLTRR